MSKYTDLGRAIWRMSRPVFLPWRCKVEQRLGGIEAKFFRLQDTLIQYGEDLQATMAALSLRVDDFETALRKHRSMINELRGEPDVALDEEITVVITPEEADKIWGARADYQDATTPIRPETDADD